MSYNNSICLDFNVDKGYCEYLMYNIDKNKLFYLSKEGYLRSKLVGCSDFMLTGNEKLILSLRYNNQVKGYDRVTITDFHNKSFLFSICNDNDMRYVLYSSKNFVEDVLTKKYRRSGFTACEGLSKDSDIVMLDIKYIIPDKNASSSMRDLNKVMLNDNYSYHYIRFDTIESLIFNIQYRYYNEIRMFMFTVFATNNMEINEILYSYLHNDFYVKLFTWQSGKEERYIG